MEIMRRPVLFLAFVTAPMLITAADQPFMELDARDPGAGTQTWTSRIGSVRFDKLGEPRALSINGVQAVLFNGRTDAYIGPAAPGVLTGASPRTVEVWVLNAQVNAPEESIVSWGRRGGPEGTAFSLNYGNSATYGAATHWAWDLAWETIPEPGKWHHLVYTYDGHLARVFDNSVEQTSRQLQLNTEPGQTINLGVQNGQDGRPQFTNALDGTPLAGSLAIALVSIHAKAMTPEAITASFNADAQRFGAVVGSSYTQLIADANVLEAGDLSVKLLANTHTVAALSPKGSSFDFTCEDRLKTKRGPGFYHLGDVTFCIRTGSSGWRSFKTTTNPSAAKPVASQAGWMVDLTAAVGPDSPLSICRHWQNREGKLTLRVVLKNTTSEPLELGALGVAMPFNNDFTGRNLDDTHENCSFTDPYMGGEAGYLQVTRVNGAGPALLVMPEKGTSFEAYRPLRDDPTPRDVTFEGFYEVTIHSKAYTENEWRSAKQWNIPTSRTLPPGGEATYGFTFALAPTIKEIEKTLLANGRPVAIAAPGYVLPTDQHGRLFVKHTSPVKSINAVPSASIAIIPDGKPTRSGWTAYTLNGAMTGWCRIEIIYTDDTTQFIHYNVIPPMREQVRRLSMFHQEKQWFTDTNDAFKRACSYMGYDRQAASMLLQDARVWNAGLSDECGAGPNLLMAMKNLLAPDPAQVAQLEQYATRTLWGNLQCQENYGVKASLFYYQPNLLPLNYYTIGGGWDKARSETIWRAYNYPHQAAVYWSLYRLARNHKSLVKNQGWEWYLTQAYRTGLAMREHCGADDYMHLAQYGLMDGTVFIEILKDLRREGWTEQADTYEAYMKERTAIWMRLKYPFGSEMPWDSTGQEEVFGWCKHFGYADKAEVCLNAIIAYVPVVPNWAYCGSSRRYFDSLVYGKLPGIFRECHHYGASLNAIPLLDTYRENPADFYLLRAGYAGANGVLSSIDQQGHGSMLFAADPAIHDYEPYSGDYGCAFFGHAHNAGSYVFKHDEFGWLGFGCDVAATGAVIRIKPRDAFRQRIFLAPAGLWLTLEAGQFEEVLLDTAKGTVAITLAAAEPHTRTARLIIEQPSARRTPAAYRPVVSLPQVRGAWEVALGEKPWHVELRRQNVKQEH